jgi:hypothetical protein
MTDFEYYQATINLSILAVPVLLWIIGLAWLLIFGKKP